jgi:NADH dehydrogenase
MTGEVGSGRERVVVIGGGFGGLTATRALRRAPVDVTLIDRTGHHLFQPLLYQVATGILSEGEIARPLREVLRRQPNADVLVGEVTEIDLTNRTVASTALGTTVVTPYDSLIVAAGASYSYFGNEQFADLAPGLKSIDDALRIRARIFSAFELADRADDPDERQRHLTFAIIGGGPTGIELAGQIRDLARSSLKDNYRNIDPASAKVVLLEAASALLPTYGTALSSRTLESLTKVGVDVRLGAPVLRVETDAVVCQTDGGEERIPATTKVWAAGVAASPVAGLLAGQVDVPRNRAGQLTLQPDCTLPGHPEVFVVGDLMNAPGIPGVAQLAIQSGRFAAGAISDRARGRTAETVFSYHDKGSLATIARFRAVAHLPHLKMSGFLAWLLWLSVHLVTLMGFGRRLSVALRWAFAFTVARRPERIGTPTQASWPAHVLTPAVQAADSSHQTEAIPTI